MRDVALALLRVAQEVGTEYKILCATLLMQLFNEANRRRLEVKAGMNLENWFRNNENDAVRLAYHEGEERGEERGEKRGEERGEKRGKQLGQAKSILAVLAARGLVPSEADQKRVLSCQDEATLSRWLVRAVTAAAVDEVFRER